MAIVLAILLAFALSPHAGAALKYRFSSVAEQSYARTVTGTVVMDGDRWRIDFDPSPDVVSDLTAIIGVADGSLIALNAENQTWFKLTSRDRLSADHSLFTYTAGDHTQVSKVKVSKEPQGASFSYRIQTEVGGEKVRGDVWGRVRLVVGDVPADLPWKALDVRTGLPPVDAEFAKLDGRLSECDIEISRRLENGAVLTQKTRRTVSDFTTTTVPASTFAVPASYRYQEPVLGVPGAH